MTTEKCSQCNTDIITCSRCRTKHCYHHFCPETNDDGKTKEYNNPPKEIWNEEENLKIISKIDKFMGNNLTIHHIAHWFSKRTNGDPDGSNFPIKVKELKK